MSITIAKMRRVLRQIPHDERGQIVTNRGRIRIVFTGQPSRDTHDFLVKLGFKSRGPDGYDYG